MFKINLVPEVQEEKLKEKKTNYYSTIFAIAVLATCILFLLIVGGIDATKRGELSSLEKKIGSTNEEISKYKDLEEMVVSLEKGIAGVKSILDGENEWTKLIPHIERAAPADVRFTKLKLTKEKVEADLVGESVNSVARFIDSYKGYKVIVLSGSGEAGSKIKIAIGSGTAEEVTVKSSGKWVYAAGIDPNADYTIKIEVPAATSTDEKSSQDNQEKKTAAPKKITVKYTAKEKKIDSTDSSINAESKNLFKDVETKEFKKSDKGVEFSATFGFEGSALW